MEFLALNRLKFYPDILFLIIVLVIIALVVGMYFLIPLLNRKKYQEQREALKKREEEFKANLEKNKDSIIVKGKKVEDEPIMENKENSLDSNTMVETNQPNE